MNEKVSRLKDLYERIVDGKYSLEDLEEAIELCEELMSEHREKKDVVGEIMLMIMKKSLEALYEEKKRKARSRLLKCIEKAREYIIDKRYFWGFLRSLYRLIVMVSMRVLMLLIFVMEIYMLLKRSVMKKTYTALM